MGVGWERLSSTLSFLVQVSLQESDYDHEYYEELEPTNCSVEEKIKGGYVTFSQVKSNYLLYFITLLWFTEFCLTEYLNYYL